MSKHTYSPMMFLAALGQGGISISFFMYLIFIIPRDEKNFIIPNFDTLKIVWDKGEILFQAIMILAILGILFFAFKHFQILFWNLKEYANFRKTTEFTKMKTTLSEISLMALPLTLAMSINVIFILGVVFIPGLWGVIEYFFPIAFIAFALVGFLALKIFSEYFVKLVLKTGNADFVNNNSLNQMLSVATFAMIGVGFSNLLAMSNNKIITILALVFSIFFITISLFLFILKIILGFRAVFEHGLNKEASPSLWITLPILTLIGLTFIRQIQGLYKFDNNSTVFIIFTTVIISLQIIFGYVGYKVMKDNKYFDDFIHGSEKSPSSFSLICPGIALVVFGFYFLHYGLLSSDVFKKFSITYFLLLAPIVYLQLKTIFVMFKLNKKFF